MNAAAAAVLADAALTAAVGGTPERDQNKDSYSCQLKCRDPNGENYTLTFGRKAVRLTGYDDEAILAAVEDWADEMAALS